MFLALQGNQMIDEEKIFIEEFQLINIKGIILIELECHHFVTPLETKDLSHDHRWLLESRERLLKNLIMDN